MVVLYHHGFKLMFLVVYQNGFRLKLKVVVYHHGFELMLKVVLYHNRFELKLKVVVYHHCFELQEKFLMLSKIIRYFNQNSVMKIQSKVTTIMKIASHFRRFTTGVRLCHIFN